MSEHPLALLVREALAGRFPSPDGGWSRLPCWAEGVEGVVAFTGHAFVVVNDDVPDQDLARLGVDGYGAAHDPRVTVALMGSGWADCLDLLLVATGTAGSAATEPMTLTARHDLADHPRVAHAQRLRREVVAYGAPTGDDVVLSLGRGVGGLMEVGIEVATASVGRGRGSEALAAVRRLVPRGQPLLASVAPGNARAVRAFLRAGFTPVGSLQLWLPDRRESSGAAID